MHIAKSPFVRASSFFDKLWWVCWHWVEWDSHCVDTAAIVVIIIVIIIISSIIITDVKEQKMIIKMQKSMMFIITWFTISAGTGMLTCVPPFLSQALVVHTLKNYIKVFENENYINILCLLWKWHWRSLTFIVLTLLQRDFWRCSLEFPTSLCAPPAQKWPRC